MTRNLRLIYFKYKYTDLLFNVIAGSSTEEERTLLIKALADVDKNARAWNVRDAAASVLRQVTDHVFDKHPFPQEHFAPVVWNATLLLRETFQPFDISCYIPFLHDYQRVAYMLRIHYEGEMNVYRLWVNKDIQWMEPHFVEEDIWSGQYYSAGYATEWE